MSAIAKAEPHSLLERYRSLRANVRTEYHHIRNVALGFIEFWRTRKTPMEAYQSMIRLFCVTGGK